MTVKLQIISAERDYRISVSLEDDGTDRTAMSRHVLDCPTRPQNITPIGKISLVLVNLTGRICSQSKVFCRCALLCRFNIPNAPPPPPTVADPQVLAIGRELLI